VRFVMMPSSRSCQTVFPVSTIKSWSAASLIAWQMDSTQGFHAIMNVFLMPMWFLSGALFPMDGAPAWLRWTMMIDPLTYGVTALRYGFYSQGLSGFTDFPTPIFCLGATAVFCALMFGLSVLVCERSGPRS
jgi:ABC-2 type transport system permease protein